MQTSRKVVVSISLWVASLAVSGQPRPPHPVIDRPPVLPPSVGRPVPPPVLRSQADAWVSTRDELVAAIGAGKKMIWVENTAAIDLSRVADHRPDAPYAMIFLPPGVTLASGRSEVEQGGTLFYSRRLDRQRAMIAMSRGSRVTGLRLRGPSRSTAGGGIKSTAIVVDVAADVFIDRNEFSDWPGQGVQVENPPNDKTSAERVRITGNYFHHNLMCGAGYGVVMGGQRGYAYIDRNTFDFNRHSVAGNGQPATGYVAELNFILSGGETCGDTLGHGHYEQHLDMHGTDPDDGRGGDAGEYIDIRRNTIRGDQTYYVIRTRPAFYLRGTPRDVAYFRQNVVAHDSQGDAVRSEYWGEKLQILDNRYDVDTSFDLAVGDFDGDGYADVLQATGAVWAYSPRGIREWRVLNYSPHRTSELRFGDFDGNGKTDVFIEEGGRLLVSTDGVLPFQPLAAPSITSMSDYRFGDFDQDGHTDIFASVDGTWYVTSAGAAPWEAINSSGRSVSELRFCDFDRDRRTDIFSFANDQWSVSFAGRTRWTRLNALRSSNLRELVFADFDGDGRCDIARTYWSVWQVSWGGRTEWRALGHSHKYLPSTLIGDFDGDRRADVMSLADLDQTFIQDVWKFIMWSGATGDMIIRSLDEMR